MWFKKRKFNKIVNELNKIPGFSTLCYVSDEYDDCVTIKLNKNSNLSDSLLFNTNITILNYSKIKYADKIKHFIFYVENINDAIKDATLWFKDTKKFIEKYRTKQDELDVLQNFDIYLDGNYFNIKLKPKNINEYLNKCKQFYKDFKYETEYREYILKTFAKTNEEIHYESPTITIDTYYDWVEYIHEPYLNSCKQDSEIEDIIKEINGYK